MKWKSLPCGEVNDALWHWHSQKVIVDARKLLSWRYLIIVSRTSEYKLRNEVIFLHFFTIEEGIVESIILIEATYIDWSYITWSRFVAGLFCKVKQWKCTEFLQRFWSVHCKSISWEDLVHGRGTSKRMMEMNSKDLCLQTLAVATALNGHISHLHSTIMWTYKMIHQWKSHLFLSYQSRKHVR